jgi:hypothetical protein
VAGDGRVSMRLTIEPAPGEAAFLWVVQSRWNGVWRTEIVPGGAREWILTGNVTPDVVRVSAVDRVGNQGPATQVRQP